MQLLVSVLIGAVAGWLAGVIMRSKSGGLLVNIILGILGGFVGNWLFNALGMAETRGWLGAIITSTVGAIVLILAGRILFKGKK